jgi:hypothetical protein
MLNLEVGSEPSILPSVEEADAYLAVIPRGSDPKGDDRLGANRIKDALDAYDNTPFSDD